MWKSKKFIVIALVAVVVLAGSIGAVAFAQTGPRTAPGRTLVAADNTSANVTLLDRVAGILKMDPQTLKSAYTQAQQQMRDEAQDKYLQDLVKQGKITDKQAADYKAWVKSKPNMPAFGPGQPFGMHRFPGGMMGGRFWGAPRPATPPTQ